VTSEEAWWKFRRGIINAHTGPVWKLVVRFWVIEGRHWMWGVRKRKKSWMVKPLDVSNWKDGMSVTVNS
jgi:hypothetical protein